MGYRRTLITFFTFLGGVYFFLEFALPPTVFGFKVDQFHEQISDGFRTIGAMALGLGIINILGVHGSKIVFRRKGWFFSLTLLCGLICMITVMAFDWNLHDKELSGSRDLLMLRDFARRIETDHTSGAKDVPALTLRRESLLNAAQNSVNSLNPVVRSAGDDRAERMAGEVLALKAATQGILAQLESQPNPNQCCEIYARVAESLGALGSKQQELSEQNYQKSSGSYFYNLLNDGLFIPLGSAMFSLLGFYIAAAAYRAFRVRSFESALMMSAALVVMLGQIPFGIWLWNGFPELRLWLLQVPNTAAFRAITIGASIAALVMAFRIWFSVESESFSKKT